MASPDRRTSVIIGIVLGQVLREALANPEYVALVVDEVGRKWAELLRGLEPVRELVAQVDPLPTGVSEPALSPDRPTDLHEFVDDFTWTVEGRQDLPDDVRARVWLAYVVKLAPPGHPIHSSKAATLGRDPSLNSQDDKCCNNGLP